MRRAALALLAAFVLVPLAAPAAGQDATEPRRQAVLVLIGGLSYRDAIGSPVLRDLARGGGIGLMTTAGRTESRSAEFVTLGAGAVGGGPDELDVARIGASADVNVNPYVAGSGDARPGALAEALEAAGLSAAYIGPPRAPGYGFLAAMDADGRVRVDAPGDLMVIETGRPAPSTSLLDVVEDALSLAMDRSDAERFLYIVTSADPSPASVRRGEQVTPVVVAILDRGEIEDGAPPDRPIGGLSSATTDIAGVVANVDVAPTILEYLGVRIPPAMTGSPIRIEGGPPTELHARYVEYQRALRPVGVTVLLFALVSLVAGGATLLFWRRTPRAFVAAIAIAGLFGVALQVALLPGSYLPEFDLPIAFGALAAAAAALTAAGLVAGRGRSAVVPVAVVSGAGLILVAVDAALGWPSLVTPLLGGSALDGVRFFGLGNSYAGVVLAGAVLVAALLPVWWGAGLIVASALFAGLPWTGADLGGGLTLFAVAGLWIGLRTRGRLDAATAGIAIGAFILGFAIIVGTHRLAEEATHVTRATVGSGGLAAIVETFWRRFTLNLEATVATPAVWPALLGVPVWLAVAWTRVGPFATSIEGSDAWRDAVIALAIGGILGYVLNDTFGMASIAFLYLSLAMVFPALRVRWKSG